MATGGVPRDSVKESDEFYPFICSPCSRTQIDIVGADVYCMQCQEYLCGKCHNSHNSFAMMANHTMLDRAQMDAKGTQRPQPQLTVQPLLTVPCDLHPGERYTLFCKEHNQVCCAVCSRIHHKSCDVSYILDVAKGAVHGPELNEFRRAVTRTMNNLRKVKRQRELDLQRMAAEKDTELNKIHTNIQQMINHLQKTEATAINDITRKFTELKTKIENDLTNLDTMIRTLDTKLDKLEKANDDIEKFVHMKICEDDKSSAKNMIKDVETRVGDEKVVFLIDEHVADSIRKLQSLGQLVLDYGYAAKPVGQHRVDTKTDKEICGIDDIFLSMDGSLMLVDWPNKCLKRLDLRYKIIDILQLDDSPHGGCAVSTSQVAVCLCTSKTVQLVILNPTMAKSRSFKTAGRCRYITCHADHLYVTCGGFREVGEGPGHISVYTISGKFVRRLVTDTQDKLFSSIPLGVAVRSRDGVILVCDEINGLVALRPDGERLWTLTLKDLEVNNVNTVTVDSHEQLLVSSKRSNKVVLVSRNGRKLGVVLIARDGINKPKGICFDEQRSRLTVGMKQNKQIKSFKLTKIKSSV